MWCYCVCVQQDERESIKNKREYRFSRPHKTIRFEWTNRLAALSQLCEQHSRSFWHGCWCTAVSLKKIDFAFYLKNRENISANGKKSPTRHHSFYFKQYWTARRWTHHLYVSYSGSDYFDRFFLFFQRNLVFPLIIEFSDQSSISPLLLRHCLDEYNTEKGFVWMHVSYSHFLTQSLLILLSCSFSSIPLTCSLFIHFFLNTLTLLPLSHPSLETILPSFSLFFLSSLFSLWDLLDIFPFILPD